MTYRTAGSGPVLLLLHGITNSSQTWETAAAALEDRFTIVAPDLLGHGHRPRRAVTTRSAPTPAASATSCRRSATTA